MFDVVDSHDRCDRVVLVSDDRFASRFGNRASRWFAGSICQQTGLFLIFVFVVQYQDVLGLLKKVFDIDPNVNRPRKICEPQNAQNRTDTPDKLNPVVSVN